MQKSTPLSLSKNLSKLSKTQLLPEQQKAITALYEGNKLLFGGLGIGKTVIAATAIQELIDTGELKRVLIITTPKIANTVWAQEFENWDHLCHIKVGIATGSAELRDQLCKSDAQVVVITFNTMADYFKRRGPHYEFDGLLIDEVSKLKTPSGGGFKAIKKYVPKFAWRAALTGTPVSESYLGLWSQVFMVDAGESLGASYSRYKMDHFYPTDYKQYNWALTTGANEVIADKIKDVVCSMKDYTDTLPAITYTTVPLTLPTQVSDYYSQLKRDSVVGDVIAVNAAVLTQKLQQVACGWVYQPDGGGTLSLSDYRIKAVQELVQEINAPVIVVYYFQYDLQQLIRALPGAACISTKHPAASVRLWNEGKTDILLVHSKAAGHGLNMAKGGCNMIWYSPVWSRDLWEQTNARIWRRGQEKPVTIYSLIATDTVDELVVQRVDDKAEHQRNLIKHLKSN